MTSPDPKPLEVFEEWRPFWGMYSVSSFGRIRRNGGKNPRGQTRRERILVPALTRGYERVTLADGPVRKTMPIHTAVALTFLGPRPFGLVINHIDGNKRNNRVANLEYISDADNIRHARRLGLIPNAPNGKLTPDQVREVRALLVTTPARVVARRFGLDLRPILDIKHGKSWKNI